MEVFSLLIFLGVIFFFLYRKDKDDREREEEIIKLFDNTVRNVLDQVESNTEKFYEMTAKMQIKHFENLERHTAKLIKLLSEKEQPRIREDVVRKLDDVSINEISKAEEREDLLSEDNRVPIVPGLNVQFEGEETVHPINIE